MLKEIDDAIQTCNQQIDGEDDDYSKLWIGMRSTLEACLTRITECQHCVCPHSKE